MLRLTDLREILRYVPRFRDRVFVIAMDGAVVEDDNFGNLLLDIALLRSLRIGVALVHGAGHQVRRLAEQTGQVPSNIDGTGVTDFATLQLALSASNRVTHEILEGLSANDLRGASSNAVVAHPAGILHGVDQQWTGRTERIDLPLLKARSEIVEPNPSKLANAVRALRGGVPRVHIIDGRVEEGLLGEVFSHEGIGTLIHANEYQAIRRAQRKDARALFALIRAGMES